MFTAYKHYFHFLWQYRWTTIWFTIFLVIFAALENINPYFYKLFVDAAFIGDGEALLWALVAYLCLSLGTLFMETIARFLGDVVLFKTSKDIRMAVFKKIQDLDFAFHLTKSTGSLISGFKRGDNAVFNLFNVVNIQLIRILVGFAVLVVLFARLNSLIALIMIASMVLNSIFAYFLIRKNISARTRFNKEEDDISGTIVDNLLNFETVKFFAKERAEYLRLGSGFVSWMREIWGYANTFRLIDIVVGLLGNASLLAVLWVGLQLFLNGEITAGEYVMVFGFVTAFYDKFFQLVFQLRDLAKNNTDLQKYFSVFNYETMVQDPENPIVLKKVGGEIVFDSVNFSYPEGRADALKNFDLTIAAGESVALVGHSGAGKTTITKLLMRFYDPDSGKITLDGVPITQLSKSHLRSWMGIVPQEPVLFNESIAYNIGYAADNATQEQVISAAKMANLHDFIITLPEAYDTKVGERGVRLSGGQKQRLAIARMILSDPSIIIFDEATSQLDSESERLIQDAFWNVSKDTTTVIIAHRLSSITRADRIIVMHDGAIAEVGTHTQLLEKKGLYAKFWKLQTVG